MRWVGSGKAVDCRNRDGVALVVWSTCWDGALNVLGWLDLRVDGLI
jgi:hypothetical protein